MSNDERSSDLPETISLCDQSDGETYALLIGVDKYVMFDELNVCDNNVDLFSDCLVRSVGVPVEHIYCLRFGFKEFDYTYLPFHHVIDQRLDDFFKLAEKNDRNKLIVMFSGHGFEADGEAYLAPTDLRITPDEEYIKDTAIAYRDLVARLNRCKVRFKWLIIDACREPGKLANDNWARAFWRVLRNSRILKSEGSVILRSCESGQKSRFDSPDKLPNHSIFISTLVEALRGSETSGQITMKYAVEYVIRKTQEKVKGLGWKQRPCISTAFNDLSRIILSDKIEGLTVPQLTIGKALIDKARRLFDEVQHPVQLGGEPQKLQDASNMVQDALDLKPDPDGKFYEEWTRLKEDIKRELQNRLNKHEQLKDKRTIKELQEQLKEKDKQLKEKDIKISEIEKKPESQNIPQTKGESISLDEYKVLQIREFENEIKSDNLRNRPNVSDSPSSLNDNSDSAPPNDKSDGEPPLNDNFEQDNSNKYI